MNHTDTTPAPVGVPVSVYWWGAHAWIDARWDGCEWRDDAGLILRGPVLFWRAR